eukprot:s1871_g2.t1
MLILWDPEYFERLWCCAEVAIFCSTKSGADQVDFVPLWMAPWVLSTVLAQVSVGSDRLCHRLMQLGGGSRLAEVTRVPESSDEEDGSPKRRRHEDPVSPKKRASDSGGAFDWGMLRQMLQEQKAEIIAANQEQTSGLLRGLDEKYEQRFLKVEQGCEGLFGKVSDMDSRLTRVEEFLSLWGGGRLFWRRRHLDNSPFTTGPRRSVALLYFGQRAGEQESDRKGRMHDVLQALLQAKPVTSHGKKMWVALSRSKQERDVSSHCSWRKRTLASFGQSHVDGLDVEYSSGTSWMGDHMVASSTRAPPVTGQDGDLVRDDRKAKHLESSELVLFGTLHVTPGLTQASYEEEVSAYFRGLRKCKRVVFQGDINASFSWSQTPEGDLAVGGDGKALILLDYLQRRDARRLWEQDRIRRASQCDWAAVKDLRQGGQSSWDVHFADHQIRDPHCVVEDHFRALYSGAPVVPSQSTVSDCMAFTVDEVSRAVRQMKSGKSVGLDLTSKELFQGILQADGGAAHLAEFFTRVLSTGVIPRDWNKSILILLAKVPLPVHPSELRPIALGSATSKLFAKLVMNRSLPLLEAVGPSQCARKHRQTCDYTFSLWRIMELCREWHRSVVCVKIDVAKAFDSVDRRKLLQTLRSKLGDTPEMRAWEGLLVDTEATLLTPWGISSFMLFSGIKQGAVESPSFFSMLMEEALHEVAEEQKWKDMELLFHDFPHEHLLFMDDGVLWSCSLGVIGTRVSQLVAKLATYTVLG